MAYFNPLSRIGFETKAFDQQYLDYIAPQVAVAVGLALRQVGDK